MFKLMKKIDPNNTHIICCLGLLKAEQKRDTDQPSDHLCGLPLDSLQKDLVYLIKKTKPNQNVKGELSLTNKNT